MIATAMRAARMSGIALCIKRSSVIAFWGPVTQRVANGQAGHPLVILTTCAASLRDKVEQDRSLTEHIKYSDRTTDHDNRRRPDSPGHAGIVLVSNAVQQGVAA